MEPKEKVSQRVRKRSWKLTEYTGTRNQKPKQEEGWADKQGPVITGIWTYAALYILIQSVSIKKMYEHT